MNSQSKNNKSGVGDQSKKSKLDSPSKKNSQNEMESEVDFEQYESGKKKNKNAPMGEGRSTTQNQKKKF